MRNACSTNPYHRRGDVMMMIFVMCHAGSRVEPAVTCVDVQSPHANVSKSALPYWPDSYPLIHLATRAPSPPPHHPLLLASCMLAPPSSIPFQYSLILLRLPRILQGS